jgi:MtrB/PioB family decaheme-associated outer membrane protein
MRTSTPKLAKTAVALCVMAAFAPARAQEETTGGLRIPESWISVGDGYVTGGPRDKSIWGQYNGLREHRNNLLLDADLVRRNEATGFWTIIRGRDLGLETPELGVTLQKQGDWRFNADYTEIVHHEIRTVNTGMLNVGSTNPGVAVITPGAGQDVNFELKRKALGLSGDKWLSRGLQFEVAFRNEDKDGTRFWGRGYDCASYVCSTTQNSPANQRWAVLMIPEPVNFNTKQIDAKLNFSGERHFVSVGYYGSFFSNANGNVAPSVPGQLYNNLTGQLSTLNPAAAGGTSLQNVLQLPMALYPDNQAHQFYVSGNYAWTQRTRSTFKLAYTHATQAEDYVGMGFTGAPTVLRPNLGGEVNTTLAQFGITTRPTSRLSLLGNVRYERRDDNTPIDLYNIENTVRWQNTHTTNSKLASKAEASYLLPSNVRATVGLDYDRINRELPDPVNVDIAGITAIRGYTRETTLRGELRRSISETLTGAIGLSYAERSGSDWYSLANVPAQGVIYGNTYAYSQIYNRTGTFPFNLTDRKRNAVKASADWLPIERLSLQFLAQAAHDNYNPPSENGLRNGSMTLYSVDATYTLTERWSLSGYGSVAQQTMGEADRANYVADTTNRNTAYGVKLTGKPTGVLEVGASITRVFDNTHYALSKDYTIAATNPVALQNAVGLPDVTFSDTRYGAYASYALNKKADVRFDVTRISVRLDEWTWGYNGVPWIFSDGTTVSINPRQQITFASARFIYKF